MNIYLTLGAFLAAFVAGWITHVWYTGYKGENAAISAEHRAAAGEAKIIHDTSAITKIVYRDKDDCTQRTLPADVLNQLH